MIVGEIYSYYLMKLPEYKLNSNNKGLNSNNKGLNSNNKGLNSNNKEPTF
jgi:hypothetical protein